MTASVPFEVLYKEHYVRVFGLCRRLLNSEHLAEDATQEIFMRAYKRFDTYDTSQPFWQWIASIANNYCIDILRKRSKTQKLFSDEKTELELIEMQDKTALALLIDAENAGALALEIKRLPDKYRVPLVLAYFNDFSYEAIAADLAISVNHVGVLLLRAKQHLRVALAGETNMGTQTL